MHIGSWTQQLWVPGNTYQPEVFQLLFTQACAYLHSYFALPSTNCSYSKYLLQTPRSQSQLEGQEGSLCLASCLAAGGVVVEVLMQPVSMKSILVLSGKWDLGVSTPCILGGHCKD